MKNLSQKSSKYILVFTIASLLWICFIFWNSFQSGESSGAMSSGIAEFIKAIIDPLNKIDKDMFHLIIRKLAHFSAFCILSILFAGVCYGVFLKNGSKNIFALLFAVLAIAVTDEFIQSFTGRGTSVRDVVLDFSGGFFGVAVLNTINIISKKIKSRRNK